MRELRMVEKSVFSTDVTTVQGKVDEMVIY